MTPRLHRQRGNALVTILLILSVAGAWLALGGLSGIRDKVRRDEATQTALAQAKQALVGFAATYRDSHAGEVFGFLPCPDLNNDGIAEPSCGGPDVSVIGRLPWRTLGLPPLRDSAGECLWYAVSGRAKDNPKTAAMNWDTTGQFILRDVAGNALTGPGGHDRPLAVIIAPGQTIAGQDRTAAGAGECGGNNTIAAYLDGNDPIYSGTPPAPGANSTLTLATLDSIRNGTHTDQAQWITADDIFARVRGRSAFAEDINDLLDKLAACLNAAPPAAGGSKGFKAVYDGITAMPPTITCPPLNTAGTYERRLLDHWQNNFLYARAAGITVNGTPCQGALLFGGARTAGQQRTTAAEIDNSANYLEGANALAFAGAGSYAKPNPNGFAYGNPGADLVRCINPLPPGSVSFLGNFSSFATAGAGVTANSANRTVTFIGAGGATGGCFWYPNPIPVAGRTVRAYFRFAFSNPDTHALTGTGTDRGNGFTFQLVRADIAGFSPLVPAPRCGRTADMGAFTTSSSGGGAVLALYSHTIENDVRQDTGNLDPTGNHTAIVTHGNLAHTPTNGTPTTACDATVRGCLHTPANRFEESPAPVSHNQRIEIATGCNGTCSACNPAAHGAPNNYVRIRVWVDCIDCADTGADYTGAAPNMQRCTTLDPQLHTAYFGFTGGFRTGAAAQGATVEDFVLSSQ